MNHNLQKMALPPPPPLEPVSDSMDWAPAGIAGSRESPDPTKLSTSLPRDLESKLALGAKSSPESKDILRLSASKFRGDQCPLAASLNGLVLSASASHNPKSEPHQTPMDLDEEDRFEEMVTNILFLFPFFLNRRNLALIET